MGRHSGILTLQAGQPCSVTLHSQEFACKVIQIIYFHMYLSPGLILLQALARSRKFWVSDKWAILSSVSRANVGTVERRMKGKLC